VDLFAQATLNHQTTVARGVMAEECGQMLRDFFGARRRAQKSARVKIAAPDSGEENSGS
jgi:tRNA(adenine34) deaminase